MGPYSFAHSPYLFPSALQMRYNNGNTDFMNCFSLGIWCKFPISHEKLKSTLAWCLLPSSGTGRGPGGNFFGRDVCLMN